MAKNYSSVAGFSRNRITSTPQTEKARPDQVMNNAGGYVFSISDIEMLRRFLILGTTGGTFYVGEKDLTKQNVDNIKSMFNNTEAGIKAVDEIVAISTAGRAPKEDTNIFALALAASCNNDEVKKYALSKLPEVCRIGTHLFTFVTYVDSMRGWGKGLRKAISSWYEKKTSKALALQVCKYPQRRVEGELPWSHRDLLRKVHLKPNSDEMNLIFNYVVKGWSELTEKAKKDIKKNENISYIWVHEQAKSSVTEKQIVDLIEEHGLVRESIPNNLFDESVWTALLKNDMPFTAMLRNIRNMTKAGALKDLSSNAKIVCKMLRDDEALKKSRIHPLHVLKALMAYNPNAIKSASYWASYWGGYAKAPDYTPNTAICDALEDAFYKSFANVQPTGKSFLIGVDVSGSMSSPMPNCPEMTSAMGAAALAMVVARTESNYKILGFSDVLKDLKITAKDSLQDALKKTADQNFGGTDISLLIRHAITNKLDVDCFVVISDNETWYGNQHPFETLKEYRKKMNRPDAKLVAIGTAATGYSIVDPEDPKGQLNLVGFDPVFGQLISDFVTDKI